MACYGWNETDGAEEVGGWKTASAVGRYMHQNEMQKKNVASRLAGVLI